MEKTVIDSCLRNQQLAKGKPANFYIYSNNDNINNNIKAQLRA